MLDGDLVVMDSDPCGLRVFALDAPLSYIQTWRRSRRGDAVLCFWSWVFLTGVSPLASASVSAQ